jgi:hypothetical protein
MVTKVTSHVGFESVPPQFQRPKNSDPFFATAHAYG